MSYRGKLFTGNLKSQKLARWHNYRCATVMQMRPNEKMEKVLHRENKGLTDGKTFGDVETVARNGFSEDKIAGMMQRVEAVLELEAGDLGTITDLVHPSMASNFMKELDEK